MHWNYSVAIYRLTQEQNETAPNVVDAVASAQNSPNMHGANADTSKPSGKVRQVSNNEVPIAVRPLTPLKAATPRIHRAIHTPVQQKTRCSPHRSDHLTPSSSSY